MICEIPLTQGYVTLVDHDIYEEFHKFRWHTEKQPNSNYAARTVQLEGKKYHFKLHRIIMDALPDQRVDHVDMNGLNNLRANLRIVTISQNSMNGKGHKDGSSAYRGVHWNTVAGKWTTQICKSGKRTSLGTYAIESDAAKAYDAAAKKLFGIYARLNFPED